MEPSEFETLLDLVAKYRRGDLTAKELADAVSKRAEEDERKRLAGSHPPVFQ